MMVSRDLAASLRSASSHPVVERARAAWKPQPSSQSMLPSPEADSTILAQTSSQAPRYRIRPGWDLGWAPVNVDHLSDRVIGRRGLGRRTGQLHTDPKPQRQHVRRIAEQTLPRRGDRRGISA